MTSAITRTRHAPRADSPGSSATANAFPLKRVLVQLRWSDCRSAVSTASENSCFALLGPEWFHFSELFSSRITHLSQERARPMSLRIRHADAAKLRGVEPTTADSWPSRLAKLIPAEAMAFYGAGQAIVPGDRNDGLWVLTVACIVFAGVIRYFGTRDDRGNPQWIAISVALISFVLWVLTLRPPAGPIDLGKNAFYAALGSLIWVTAVPFFYKGD